MIGNGELKVPPDQKRLKAVFRLGGFPILNYGSHRFVLSWMNGAGQKEGVQFAVGLVIVSEKDSALLTHNLHDPIADHEHFCSPWRANPSPLYFFAPICAPRLGGAISVVKLLSRSGKLMAIELNETVEPREN